MALQFFKHLEIVENIKALKNPANLELGFQNHFSANLWRFMLVLGLLPPFKNFSLWPNDKENLMRLKLITKHILRHLLIHSILRP